MGNGNFINVHDEALIVLQKSLLSCKDEFNKAKKEIQSIVSGIIGNDWRDPDSKQFKDEWDTKGEKSIIQFTEIMDRFATYLGDQHSCLMEYHNLKVCSI